MSFQAEKDAWAIIESGAFSLTPTDKIVLMKVAFWANKEDECWYGIEAIATGCNAHRSTVIEALRKLAKFGLLSRRTRQKKGGGRGFDVILFHCAAKSESATSSRVQQGRNPRAARSESTVQQSRISRPRSSKASEKGSEKGSESATVGSRQRQLPLPSIDGLKLTEAELSLAAAALMRFNERNNSRLILLGRANRATDSLKRIVCRLREANGLTAEDLQQIVDRTFDNPPTWWDGETKVGIGHVFGPKAWAGSMANDGVIRSGRRVRRGADKEFVPPAAGERKQPW